MNCMCALTLLLNMCVCCGCRNSSALPSMGELNSSAKTDKDRKNSMLIPNGNHMIESGKIGASSLAAAGSNVIGGQENYKRF